MSYQKVLDITNGTLIDLKGEEWIVYSFPKDSKFNKTYKIVCREKEPKRNFNYWPFTTYPEYRGDIPAKYLYGKSVQMDEIVNVISQVNQIPGTKNVSGLHCADRRCNLFNEYAEPNMPDGKYFCFSCRQRPAYEHK